MVGFGWTHAILRLLKPFVGRQLIEPTGVVPCPPVLPRISEGRLIGRALHKKTRTHCTRSSSRPELGTVHILPGKKLLVRGIHVSLSKGA